MKSEWIPEKDNKEKGEQYLKENGFTDWEVVTAAPNELQLDYDSPTLPLKFYEILEILSKRTESSIPYKVFTSKGGNTHVIITLPVELDVVERISWQAALGSDNMKESLSLLSVARGVRNPVLLFMHKNRKPVFENVCQYEGGPSINNG